MLSLIAVVCSLFALSWGCCTPDQWEGYEGVLAGYSGYIKRGSIEESNWVSYDYTNKRAAVYKTYVNGDIEAKFKYIVRYCDEGGMLFVINLKRGKCWKKAMKGEFRKACIPEKAKDLGNYFLGLAGKFKLHGYLFGREKFASWLSVQEVDDNVCAPASETVLGKFGHYGVMEQVAFIDITPGIKNESIFDVPKICEERKSVYMTGEEPAHEFYLALSDPKYRDYRD